MDEEQFIHEITTHDATPHVVVLEEVVIPPNYEREHPVYGPSIRESIYRFANDTGAAVTRFDDGTVSFNYLGFHGLEITNFSTVAKAYFDSEGKVQHELRMLQSKAYIETTKGKA